MKPTVYVETSVISYLAARKSRVARVAARQEITQEWWASAHEQFRLYASRSVIDEASQGDEQYAKKRLQYLDGLPVLHVTSKVDRLAEQLVIAHAIPTEAADDAAHIAIAVTHGLRYLVTWNCRHIANAQKIEQIERVCRKEGFKPIVLCTPEQLLGD